MIRKERELMIAAGVEQRCMPHNVRAFAQLGASLLVLPGLQMPLLNVNMNVQIICLSIQSPHGLMLGRGISRSRFVLPQLPQMQCCLQFLFE